MNFDDLYTLESFPGNILELMTNNEHVPNSRNN